MEETKIVQGADPKIVGPYLAEALGDHAWSYSSVELIAGGRSNLTYLVTAAEKELVLRRPPLGHVLPTAHDMTREFTVISALHGTDVPVPEAIHLCTDQDVLRRWAASGAVDTDSVASGP